MHYNNGRDIKKFDSFAPNFGSNISAFINRGPNELNIPNPDLQRIVSNTNF